MWFDVLEELLTVMFVFPGTVDNFLLFFFRQMLERIVRLRFKADTQIMIPSIKQHKFKG